MRLSFCTRLPHPVCRWTRPFPHSNLPQIGPQIMNQAYISNRELQHQPDLFPFYYGYRRIAQIQLIASESREMHANINYTGYSAIADVQSLRQLGYRATVSEAASFWKTHKRSARHPCTRTQIYSANSRGRPTLSSALDWHYCQCRRTCWHVAIQFGDYRNAHRRTRNVEDGFTNAPQGSRRCQES